MSSDEQVRNLQARNTELEAQIQALKAQLGSSEEMLESQQNEQRCKQLLATVVDYCFILSACEGERVTTHFDAHCSTLTGYSLEAYQSDPDLWYRIIYPPDREAVESQCQQLLSGETVEPLEYRIVHRSGLLRWVRHTAVPRNDRREHSITYDILIQDLTEGRRTQQILQQEEKQLFQTLVATLPVGVWLVHPDGQVAWTNTAGLQLWQGCQHPAGELSPGRSETHLTHLGEIAQALVSLQARVMREGGAARNEIIDIGCLDGTQRTLLAAAVSLKSQQGHCLGAILIGQDITALRQMEVALRDAHDVLEKRIADRTAQLLEANQLLRQETRDRREAAQALQRSEALLRNVVTNSPIILYAADRKGMLTLSEGKGLETIGLRSGELVGQSLFEIYRDYPETLSYLRRVLAGEEGVWFAEFNQRFFDNRATPLRDQRGRVTGLIGVATDITEHTRIEQALRDSEVRFRGIFNQAGVGIAQLGLSGRFLLVNRKFADILHNSVQNLKQKRFQEIVHPEEWAAVQAYFRQVTTDQSRQGSLEQRFLRKDGSTAWVLLTVSLVRDKSGQPESLIVVVQDVGDRQQAIAALQASEYRYYNLTRSLPVGVCRTDVEGNCLYTNEQWCELTGLAPAEAIGESWLQSVHPADRDQVRSGWQQAVRDRQLFQAEYRCQLSNGTVTWVVGQMAPEQSHDREAVYYVGTVTDITKRKQAEAAIRESEEKFRQLAENIHQVFWIIAPDSQQVLYVSPAYEDVWGHSRQSLYKEANAWMEAVHPDDRDRVLVSRQQRLSQGGTSIEYRITKPDGSVRWIWDRAFPIRRETGQVYRIAGIAEDITERKQAEIETQNALAEEKELNTLKSRFISMVSHEFRTPLSVIISSVDLLEYYLQHGGIADKQMEHIARIQQAVQTMTHLLNDVLTIGKAESGKLQFQPIPLDLDQFCRNLVEELKITDRHHHEITFQVHVAASSTALDNSEIYMDKQLLHQIFSNLLSNALKYSLPGSTVQLHLTYQADKAVFEVRDAGIGIPPEDQAHLFQLFHRATNVGTISGTGLGLAIVRQAVERHGGQVWIKSTVDQGTTVTVVLPLDARKQAP